MSKGPHRRQLLKAVAGSGIVASVAGCLGRFEAGGGATGPESTASRGSDGRPSSRGPRSPHGRACPIGADLIAALGDGDFETVVSYYPYEHLEDEDVDEAALVEELEHTDWGYEWVDGEIEEISCECAQAYPAETLDEFASDVTGDVTAALELRYAVTYEAAGETVTDSVYVDAIEVTGDWSATLSIGGSRDLCAPESEFDDEERSESDADSSSDSDSHSEDDQPLDGAVWEDVDEIVLEADVSGWVGVEPAPIEGVENPTLLLFEGHEYEIEWRHGDSAIHDFRIRDADGDPIVQTELAEPDQTPLSLTVTATAAMDEYVCAPHTSTMIGDIVVEPR